MQEWAKKMLRETKEAGAKRLAKTRTFADAREELAQTGWALMEPSDEHVHKKRRPDNTFRNKGVQEWQEGDKFRGFELEIPEAPEGLTWCECDVGGSYVLKASEGLSNLPEARDFWYSVQVEKIFVASNFAFQFDHRNPRGQPLHVCVCTQLFAMYGACGRVFSCVRTQLFACAYSVVCKRVAVVTATHSCLQCLCCLTRICMIC